MKYCDPLGGVNFDPRGIIWTTLVEDLLMMLHIIYESTGPCSFRQEDFWKFHFKTYFSSFSRKYEKLPNIVIHACKKKFWKMYLLKMSGPQIWLCLFTFRLIASKQLNSLTTIDTLSWLGGAVVTHPLWVQELPGSIPGSGNGFYVWLLVLLLLCCCFLCVQKHIIFHKISQFLLHC